MSSSFQKGRFFVLLMLVISFLISFPVYSRVSGFHSFRTKVSPGLQLKSASLMS